MLQLMWFSYLDIVKNDMYLCVLGHKVITIANTLST